MKITGKNVQARNRKIMMINPGETFTLKEIPGGEGDDRQFQLLGPNGENCGTIFADALVGVDLPEEWVE